MILHYQSTGILTLCITTTYVVMEFNGWFILIICVFPAYSALEGIIWSFTL